MAEIPMLGCWMLEVTPPMEALIQNYRKKNQKLFVKKCDCEIDLQKIRS